MGETLRQAHDMIEPSLACVGRNCGDGHDANIIREYRHDVIKSLGENRRRLADAVKLILVDGVFERTTSLTNTPCLRIWLRAITTQMRPTRGRTHARHTPSKWFIYDVIFTIVTQNPSNFSARATVVGDKGVDKRYVHCIFYVVAAL